MDEPEYLDRALGLVTRTENWEGTAELPAFLRASCTFTLATTPYGEFLLARPSGDAALPDLKRIHTQLQRWTNLPVVLSVPGTDARQRAALVRQGVPFICAGREVFLPFIGMAGHERSLGGAVHADARLTPKALQAACWVMENQDPLTLAGLREATGMSAGQASSAAGELVRCGIATRTKTGRTVVILPAPRDEVLSSRMRLLSSPVRKVLLVKRTKDVLALPDAGETALAARSSLNEPVVVQKAASPEQVRNLKTPEVLEGEFSNSDVASLQVWRYHPLFRGRGTIDDVSLALSLAGTEDERVAMAVDELFGKEHPWHEAT